MENLPNKNDASDSMPPIAEHECGDKGFNLGKLMDRLINEKKEMIYEIEN